MRKEIFRFVTTNPFLLFCLLLLLSLPLIASWGQFLTTGFLTETVQVLLLFWPKAEWRFALPLPGWLIFGAISLLYVVGIVWLIRKKSLGEAILFLLAGFLLAKAGGFVFQAISGLTPTQQMSAETLAGKSNLLVFAAWHNPLWEEVVFRGIPLLLLKLIYRTNALPLGAKWLYILLPSIVFAIYHVPGHGIGTLLESFLIGVLWAWAALRWGLLAPIVLHIFADAMKVPTLAQIKGIPAVEIPWLVEHSRLLNTTWSLSILLFLTLVLILALIGWRKSRKKQATGML